MILPSLYQSVPVWYRTLSQAYRAHREGRLGVESKLLSITDAAKILGISRNKAYKLVREGNFPVTVLWVGHRRKISRDELMVFVRATDENKPTPCVNASR